MIHIAYAEMQNNPPHLSHVNRMLGTGYYAIILFSSKAIIETGNGMINSDAPSMIIFDKFSKQHYYSEENHLIIDSIHFDADSKTEKNIAKNLVLNTPFSIKYPEPIQKLMWLIISEYQSISKHKETTINTLFKILINKIAEEIKLYELKQEYGIQSGILHVKKRIIQNPGYNWTIKELAAGCKMSESYFQVTYKKLFASTCIDDVIKARLKMAKNLIENSNSSVKDISAHCGYRRSEHFSRQFKEAYGMSPGKYRKHHISKKISETQEL